MKRDANELWLEQEWPFHMRGDVHTHNENLKAGRALCSRCEGTGNEFLSMYKRCTDCSGTGAADD